VSFYKWLCNSACVGFGLEVGADANVTYSKSLYFSLYFKKDPTAHLSLKKIKRR
jgi:hypothetical protein